MTTTVTWMVWTGWTNSQAITAFSESPSNGGEKSSSGCWRCRWSTPTYCTNNVPIHTTTSLYLTWSSEDNWLWHSPGPSAASPEHALAGEVWISRSNVSGPVTINFIERGQKRRDCRVCSMRQDGKTRHLTQFYCAACSDTPALCPGNCFKTFHTRLNYHWVLLFTLHTWGS